MAQTPMRDRDTQTQPDDEGKVILNCCDSQTKLNKIANILFDDTLEAAKRRRRSRRLSLPIGAGSSTATDVEEIQSFGSSKRKRRRSSHWTTNEVYVISSDEEETETPPVFKVPAIPPLRKELRRPALAASTQVSTPISTKVVVEDIPKVESASENSQEKSDRQEEVPTEQQQAADSTELRHMPIINH